MLLSPCIWFFGHDALCRTVLHFDFDIRKTELQEKTGGSLKLTGKITCSKILRIDFSEEKGGGRI